MHRAVSLLASILSPSRCAACDARAPSTALLCAACAVTVERSSDPHAPFVYGGALATAITRFKFGRTPELARPLGALLAKHALSFAPTHSIRTVDIVVPVPLHPSRLFERGFNQAALLARPVARALGARLSCRALERVRPTETQSLLDRSARIRNMAGAFRVRDDFAEKKVLLIDDVRTTGATQEACAAAFREVGCPDVQCLVLAIAPPIAYP